jgi:hypothetical protein
MVMLSTGHSVSRFLLQVMDSAISVDLARLCARQSKRSRSVYTLDSCFLEYLSYIDKKSSYLSVTSWGLLLRRYTLQIYTKKKPTRKADLQRILKGSGHGLSRKVKEYILKHSGFESGAESVNSIGLCKLQVEIRVKRNRVDQYLRK